MYWLNGSFHEDDQPALLVSDRGFLLGDGFFETMRIHEGRPVWFAEHWARLKASAEWAFMPFPYHDDQTHGALRELALRTKLPNASARITYSRGSGGRGLALPEQTKPSLLITMSALPQAFPAEGISLAIASERRSVGGSEWAHKALHYLPAVREMELAKRSGCQDCLWISPAGEVLESAMANLFWVKGDTLFTPPADGSILPGVARAKILEYTKLNQISYIEAHSDLSVVQNADSVFLANSVRGIIPVCKVGGMAIQGGRSLEEKIRHAVFSQFANI